MEEEIVFVPAIKKDMVRTVYVFLREINYPEAPYQMTITLNDYSFGRLGYYDLSYKSLDEAKKQFDDIIKVIKEVREEAEYNLLPCYEMEKLCKKSIDKVLQHAHVYDSTYHGRYNGRQIG